MTDEHGTGKSEDDTPRQLDWTEGVPLTYFLEHPEEASPAAVKAMAQRLWDVGVSSTPLGEKLPPGLRADEPIPIDPAKVRSLASTFVRSTAIHSRSRGWLPHVMVTIEHDDPTKGGDPRELHLLIPADHTDTLAQELRQAGRAARRDAQYGVRER